mgnify:CR=1
MKIAFVVILLLFCIAGGIAISNGAKVSTFLALLVAVFIPAGTLILKKSK